MSFELGRTIDGYEFVDILENTRNAVVYRVRNVAEHRFEMLRVLAPALQEDPVRVERFMREGKILARMSHPNIISLYSAQKLDGQLVLTTELLEGSTLAQRVELGPIPWAEACGYFAQMLSALGYAHSQGIVHREITPSTVLVTPDGVVKLINFGLAKGPADPRVTVAGAVLGPLYYMSPEQVKGSEIGTRSDIYSAGVALYKVLTGRVPFDLASQFDVMLAHVQAQPIPPSAMFAGVPPEFDAVVLKAMAKDPSERFRTAEEFMDALGVVRSFLEGKPFVQPVPARPQPVVEPAPARVPALSPAGPEPAAGAPLSLVFQATTPRLMLAGVVIFLVAVIALVAVLKAARG
jgi:serine/threonine-protein kinase